MADIQIQLSALWVSLMFTLILGDLIRILSGDVKAGVVGGMKIGKEMWLGIAVLMVIPIAMIPLALILPNPLNRTLDLIAAAFFFIFNALGLPSYPSTYSRFLVVVGMLINVLTFWLAWNWV
jgi:hypothetical protein